MKRPSSLNDEIKSRIKTMKIVSKHYNPHLLPYDDPKTVEKAGSYATINESNPMTFTIDIYVPKDKIEEKALQKITTNCIQELRKLPDVKPVICYGDNSK